MNCPITLNCYVEQKSTSIFKRPKNVLLGKIQTSLQFPNGFLIGKSIMSLLKYEFNQSEFYIVHARYKVSGIGREDLIYYDGTNLLKNYAGGDSRYTFREIIDPEFNLVVYEPE